MTSPSLWLCILRIWPPPWSYRLGSSGVWLYLALWAPAGPSDPALGCLAPPLGIQASAAAVILQTGSHLDVKPKWPAQQAFGHIDLVVIFGTR